MFYFLEDDVEMIFVQMISESRIKYTQRLLLFLPLYLFVRVHEYKNFVSENLKVTNFLVFRVYLIHINEKQCSRYKQRNYLYSTK